MSRRSEKEEKKLALLITAPEMDNEGNETTVKSANSQKSLKGTAVKKYFVPNQKKSTVQDSFSRLLKKKQDEDKYCTMEKFVINAPFSEIGSPKRPLSGPFGGKIPFFTIKVTKL